MKNNFIVFWLLVASTFGCKTVQDSKANGNEESMSSHNSRNSLDWSGVYRGILPCADCEGIRTEIKLNSELTYVISYQYLGKNDVTSTNGSFKWNKEGNSITLLGIPEPNGYFVGENMLVKLDKNGKIIQGELAEKYILKKEGNVITEKYWKLVELNGQKVKWDENEKQEPHFILKEKDKTVAGHGGCNSFHGTYELLEGSRIRFSKMASTMMACADMETESQFLRAMEMADNYNLNGDTLQLNKARMAPLARFEAVYFR